MFRRAIWNYIQCIYGIRHDDYDYREVNELLARDLKKYIKDVCCFPHRVKKEDCDRVMPEFWRSEKVSLVVIKSVIVFCTANYHAY
jgi:sestrin